MPQLAISETANLIVDSRKGKSKLDEKPCLLVKYNENTNWENLEATIQGFEYEEGFEYVLKIEMTTLESSNQDNIKTSLTTYKLLNVVSKIKK